MFTEYGLGMLESNHRVGLVWKRLLDLCRFLISMITLFACPLFWGICKKFAGSLKFHMIGRRGQPLCPWFAIIPHFFMN